MKIKNLLHVLLCGFLFLSASCKKDNQHYTTKANGIVRNKLTGQAVQGIPLEMYGCSFIGSSVKCLDRILSTVTDQNGYYEMTVEADKRQGYEIAITSNGILAPTPNAAGLVTGKSNTTDFSQFPIKKLKAHVVVKRHNRNWLDLGIGNNDYFDFFSLSLYHGSNPTADFDSTYIFDIEAGRQYKISCALSDRTAPYTNINYEYFYNLFTVNNTDTTFVDFVFQ